MGRVLGVDAGERRVGLALSDETRLLATPLTVLTRDAGLAPVLDRIASIVRDEGVTLVVVGLPLNENGTAGRQAKRATDFARLIEKVCTVPARLWDERLSTREAEAIVRAQGGSVRRRQDVDAVAAAVILQDFLDHSHPLPPNPPRPPEGKGGFSSIDGPEVTPPSSWDRERGAGGEWVEQ